MFANVIEPHGGYSPVSELAVDLKSRVSALDVVHDDDDYTAVAIQSDEARVGLFIIAYGSSDSQRHRLRIEGTEHQWSGPYLYVTP